MNQVNNKKISVIMGIFNCAETLPEAIESIISQTYTNWELIMCDDGSADKTYLVAQEYAEKYENIKLYKNETNMGLNFTLNHCLKFATGDYIARMDGDDISLPKRFKTEIDFLETHPKYSIVSTPMYYFDENGIFKTGVGNGEPSINVFAKGTPFCHAPCLVKKQAYDTVNGYTVSEKFLRVEDWQLWIKMYVAGFRGYMLKEPLYKMRDDRNAVARRKFKYRINEARVSCMATKQLNLPKWHYVLALRPIIVGLLPSFVYDVLHKR